MANPVRDAQLLQQNLKATPLSFKVTYVDNANRVQLLAALSSFKRQAQGAEVALVYYSGHGMINSRRQNHLLPVDMPRISANAGLDVDTALEAYGVSEDKLIEAIEGAKVQVAILDACRDNGFGGQKSGTKGLSRRYDQSRNRLLAYATEEGFTAEDGASANSTYAASLAKHLVRTDWPLLRVFDEVASDVERSTKGVQTPTRSGNLRTDVYLLASLRAEPNTGYRPQQADPEQELWEVAKRRDTVAAYLAYLNRYPQGRFAETARVALEGVQPAAASARPTPSVPVQAVAPSPTMPTTQSGQVFKDCREAQCPEMLVIPAGSFEMGSNDYDSEKPPHRVSINSFALGKYEVTQGQWKAVMGSNPSIFSNCGDTCPVEQVSWDDIQQYISKLNQKTGQNYRLPSEAEWEYAARAGSTTKYSWGDNIGRNNANCDGCGSQWDNKTIAPVGSFKPNAFGLYDMHGNVWEWVQDVRHNNYQGAPTDGSAWTSAGDQSRRVLRGGSWDYGPQDLRSANRGWNAPGFRYGLWFRLARTVP